MQNMPIARNLSVRGAIEDQASRSRSHVRRDAGIPKRSRTRRRSFHGSVSEHVHEERVKRMPIARNSEVSAMPPKNAPAGLALPSNSAGPGEHKVRGPPRAITRRRSRVINRSSEPTSRTAPRSSSSGRRTSPMTRQIPWSLSALRQQCCREGGVRIP